MKAISKRIAKRTLTPAVGKEASAGVRHSVPQAKHITAPTTSGSWKRPAAIGLGGVGVGAGAGVALHETRQFVNALAPIPDALLGPLDKLGKELADDLSQVLESVESAIDPLRPGSLTASAINVVAVGLVAYGAYFYFFSK